MSQAGTNADNQFIVYIDETGDHTLDLVDKDFPVFVLVMLVFKLDYYATNIVPALCKIKMEMFGHEGVIFHSRDIRKRQGDFYFLNDPAKNVNFIERTNRFMADSEYVLIASVIRKQHHKDKYGDLAENPYELAMKFAMERLLVLLEDAGQKSIHLIAEARGKREDDELRLSFLKTINEGTGYNSAERFKKINFKLHFVSKQRNISGTQMADLAAYPIARYILDEKKPNPPYEIIKNKFYRKNGKLWGLKVFPK